MLYALDAVKRTYPEWRPLGRDCETELKESLLSAHFDYDNA